MIRFLACALFLVTAWQSQASPPQAPSSQPAASAETLEAASPERTLDEQKQELLRVHAGIWSLMGLSPQARDELNGIVVSINTRVHENRDRYPEDFARARAVKRSETPPTREEYFASHKRRFELLGISKSTREELFRALDLVWKALHDPTVPEEQREAAIAIREMMKSMGGPPPCCDENIFLRAGMRDHRPR